MKKTLTLFSIIVMTITSVASIRNLPCAAFYGSHLIFFFCFGAFFFLLPTALISAELVAAWPERGGLYFWVQKAFGNPWGFLSVWFQWIANIVWYPLALSFFAGTIAYLFADENIATNPKYLIGVILVTYWLMILINLFGIRVSGKLNSIFGILGYAVPLCGILFAGVLRLSSPEPLPISFSSYALLPPLDLSILGPLVGFMLSFCGIEIATIHISHVDNPQKKYPLALLAATLVIAAIFIFGSLSIAIMVPRDHLSMVSGVMQAFATFLTSHGWLYALPFLSALVSLGSFSGMSNWVLAIAQGLSAATKEGTWPSLLQRENRFGAPYPILIAQGCIVSIFSCFFILMPTINSSFWVLTVIASQLYMLMYLLLFTAALRLRFLYPSLRHSFKTPERIFKILVGMGCFACLFAFVIGFEPPAEMNIKNIYLYKIAISTGLLFCCSPLLLLARKKYREMQSH